MTEQLKPCPFCGEATATIGCIRDGRQVFCATCHSEGSPMYHGPADGPDAETRAIAAWNRRAEVKP